MEKEEKIIKKYRLGFNSRVKFRGIDDRIFYVKNISPNRTDVFITTDSGVGVMKKKIKNIIWVDGKFVDLSESKDLVITNIIKENLKNLKK